jgi:plastocyanin
VNPRHPITAVMALGATAILAAGCGGSSDASAPTPTQSGGGSSTSGSGSTNAAASGASSGAVQISDFKFAPGRLTVGHGAKVTVANDDTTAHTATSDDGQTFDTGTIQPGASGTISVTKPGTYAYHCTIHPFMHGTLVVR